MNERHVPNPKLIRNKILQPVKNKPFEEKIVRTVDTEDKAYTDYYRFMLALIDQNQIVDDRIANKPILKLKSMLSKPKEMLLRISRLVKKAQSDNMRQMQMLDSQFK